MWDTLSLKKRAYPGRDPQRPRIPKTSAGRRTAFARASPAQGFGHLRARSYGQHILIESRRARQAA